MEALIRASDYDALREKPLIRDAATEHLFRASGMVPGTVATFYLIPPDTWAEIIRRARGDSSQLRQSGGTPEDYGTTSAVEGAKRLKVHLARERDPRLAESKKQQVFNSEGRLVCEVCAFDFERRYGERGRGVCEVHHRTPLSARPDDGSITGLDDLAIVCANCHLMLHQRAIECSIDLLRTTLR